MKLEWVLWNLFDSEHMWIGMVDYVYITLYPHELLICGLRGLVILIYQQSKALGILCLHHVNSLSDQLWFFQTVMCQPLSSERSGVTLWKMFHNGQVGGALAKAFSCTFEGYIKPLLHISLLRGRFLQLRKEYDVRDWSASLYILLCSRRRETTLLDPRLEREICVSSTHVYL